MMGERENKSRLKNGGMHELFTLVRRSVLADAQELSADSDSADTPGNTDNLQYIAQGKNNLLAQSEEAKNILQFAIQQMPTKIWLSVGRSRGEKECHCRL